MKIKKVAPKNKKTGKAIHFTKRSFMAFGVISLLMFSTIGLVYDNMFSAKAVGWTAVRVNYNVGTVGSNVKIVISNTTLTSGKLYRLCAVAKSSVGSSATLRYTPFIFADSSSSLTSTYRTVCSQGRSTTNLGLFSFGLQATPGAVVTSASLQVYNDY